MPNMPERTNETSAGTAQKTIRSMIESGEFPRGLDTPWLGSVPLTADGCVAGDCAEVWFTEGVDEPIAKARLDKCGYTCTAEGFWPVEETYSTREAAEAARGAQ